VSENETIAKRVLDIRHDLALRKTGKFLVDTAVQEHAWICLLPGSHPLMKGKDAEYAPGDRVVSIRDDAGADLHTDTLKKINFLRLLAHELRHLWQDYMGLLRRNSTFSSLPAYESSRLFAEADAESVANLVLWEADQQDGGSRLNDYMVLSQHREKTQQNRIVYSDITRQFMRTANITSTTEAPVNAMRMAFRQWLDHPSRTDSYRDGIMQECFRSRLGVCNVTDRPEKNGHIPIPPPSLRRQFSGFGDLPHYQVNYLNAGEGFDYLLMSKTPNPARGQQVGAAP
jgi:hypothetical protein